MDSRNELDLVWGRKTERWFVGAFKNNSIFILNHAAYSRESSHEPKEFWQTLKHEYCHYYYTQITKSHYPVWLNEGLASYVSGKKLVLGEDHRDRLPNVVDYFSQVDKSVYAVGQFWVEFLIKQYGKINFLKLINSFNQEFDCQQFTKKFYQVYGFRFTRNSFLKFLK